jgi:hypothetical protein
VVTLRDLLKRPRAFVRATGFDIIRYAPPALSVVDARRMSAIRRRKVDVQGYEAQVVSREDVLMDRETGFVLQADCIFVI